MRLWIYLGMLASIGGVLGVSAAGNLRPQAAPSPRTWRAIGAMQPRISPDGESIAFACQGALWRIPRAGGVMRRLTAEPAWDSCPAWSPDGKKIAFLSAGLLQLMDADSGVVSPLPARISARDALYFHADGKRLMANCRAANGFALSWVDLATGATKSVFTPPAEARVFALSPDGASVVYAVHQDVQGEQGGHNGPQADLWIAASEGGEAKKLVRFRSRIFDLAWGGATIFGVSDLGGAHNDLWEIPLKDPELSHRLTWGQADEDAPSVAGSWLLYTDNREGSTALMTRDLATGDEKIVAVSGMDYGKPTGQLSLEFVEKGTGRPLVVRVAVQEDKGKPAAPPGALYRLHDQMDFTADRSAELRVPAGRYHLHAYHGPEYRMAHLEVDVPAGKTTTQRIELERWTDPAARGWYSGENHIHANYGYGQWYCTPDEMRRMIEAEGLNVANFVVANSNTDGVFDREFFRGQPDPGSGPRNILYWNEEFRATLWGHLTLVNLKQLVEPIFTGFLDTTNPWDAPTNSDIADHTHLQGGHVNYTHAAQNVADPYLSAYSGKSVPMDVALGKIDSIDINGYYDATVPLWHRLLNCGFRVPASAGTDVFLNKVQSALPGNSRCYVKIDGEFSYQAWIQGLKAGRTFVTSGPILDFEPGRTIPGSADIPIQAQATSQVPIDRFEAVVNGEVVAKGTIAADKLSATLDHHVAITKSGWFGVRVYAGKQQAHSGPVYVEVAGKPAGSKVDAEYFLAWIDRLEAQLQKRDRVPGDALKKHVSDQLNAAREVYRKIAARD